MTDPIVVKAGAEAVDAIAKPTQEFLTKIAGTPGLEIGEILGDRLRVRRYRNAVRLADKARKYAEKKGIDPEQVPLTVLLPVLEKGSLEDDEALSDRWAALLASAAMDPGKVHRSFASILSQLDAVEANILDAVYRAIVIDQVGDPDIDWRLKTITYVGVHRALGVPMDNQYAKRIENLFRLRLLAPPATKLDFIENKDYVFVLEGTSEVRLTELGRGFVEACTQLTAPD